MSPLAVKRITIAPSTLDILRRCQIEADRVVLPEQLDRAAYELVNKALLTAGGKWNRGARAHLFQTDPRELFAQALDTGTLVNDQQTYQAFFTPPDLADQMIDLAGLQHTDRLLEPSAGDGAILRRVKARGIDCHITAVELDPRKTTHYHDEQLAHALHHGDFLTYHPMHRFDKILMNPPFTRGQDIAHVHHAHTLLAPGGVIVAICSGGPKAEDVLKPMALQWDRFDAGAFKKSGTMVTTVLAVFLNKGTRCT